MISGNKTIYLDQTIDSNTTTVGETITLPNGAINLIILCKVSNRTDGTYTLTIEHSPDGENYDILDSVSAISADGIEYERVTVSSFHKLRASLLSSGVTTGADVECSIHYARDKHTN